MEHRLIFAAWYCTHRRYRLIRRRRRRRRGDRTCRRSNNQRGRRCSRRWRPGRHTLLRYCISEFRRSRRYHPFSTPHNQQPCRPDCFTRSYSFTDIIPSVFSSSDHHICSTSCNKRHRRRPEPRARVLCAIASSSERGQEKVKGRRHLFFKAVWLLCRDGKVGRTYGPYSPKASGWCCWKEGCFGCKATARPQEVRKGCSGC